jgi:hypothetical protein
VHLPCICKCVLTYYCMLIKSGGPYFCLVFRFHCVQILWSAVLTGVEVVVARLSLYFSDVRITDGLYNNLGCD